VLNVIRSVSLLKLILDGRITIQSYFLFSIWGGWWDMMFNVTFNNISVILWQLVLLVEETGVPGEIHRPIANQWQTLSHNAVSSTPHVSDDKYWLHWSNYHMIKTTMAFPFSILFCIWYECEQITQNQQVNKLRQLHENYPST
jgi:hypothetical protein